jgi:GNAT superfamily N-acetyltransferase
MSSNSLQIVGATEYHWEGIWTIFRQVVSPGDTYVYDPATDKPTAHQIWMCPEAKPFVALRDGQIVGTYILKPNQPALGSHVANAGFMVHPEARGAGVGLAMGRHALETARSLGYSAMQFNFVVSTNTAAVELWQKLGFSIVGRLPGAFRHARLGFVDAYVMFREL